MSFDLTSEPWIPVNCDGRRCMMGLAELFKRGEEAEDLSLHPHDRVAVYNLLLALIHAALRGPVAYEDWERCRHTFADSALAYLGDRSVRPCFQLFGERTRFLQIKGEGSPGTASLGKLGFVDEKGTTLFQPHLQVEWNYSEAWTALRLLTFQSFSAGGKIGGSEIKSGRTRPVSAWASPRRADNAVHCYVKGRTLAETLWLNLFSQEELDIEKMPLGKPVWETLARLQSQTVSELKADAERVRSLTHSHVGRLVPLSRSLWLADDLRTVEITVGLDYPGIAHGVRDATQTRLTRQPSGHATESPAVLGCAKGGRIQEVWREIPAVVHASRSSEKPGAPLAVQRCMWLDEAKHTDLWLGALAGNQASVIAAWESSYRFPTLPSEDDLDVFRAAYQAGVAIADAEAQNLARAILSWCDHSRPIMRKANPEEFKRFVLRRKICAEKAFWSLLQVSVQVLIDEAGKAVGHPSHTLPLGNESPWRKAVWRARDRAFAEACPSGDRLSLRAFAMAKPLLTKPFNAGPK